MKLGFIPKYKKILVAKFSRKIYEFFSEWVFFISLAWGWKLTEDINNLFQGKILRMDLKNGENVFEKNVGNFFKEVFLGKKYKKFFSWKKFEAEAENWKMHPITTNTATIFTINISKWYNAKTELFFTDANEVDVENVYEDFCKGKKLFTFNNCLKKSNYYDNTNNLVAGKINETCDMPIKCYVGSKAKMYTYTTKNDHQSKNTIGIIKNVVNNEWKYEDYKDVLFNWWRMRY